MECLPITWVGHTNSFSYSAQVISEHTNASVQLMWTNFVS